MVLVAFAPACFDGLPPSVDVRSDEPFGEQLKTALRRENLQKVRLIIGTSPSRDVLVTAAAEARIDLQGPSECARLLRAAIMREDRLMAHAAGGAQYASEALRERRANVPKPKPRPRIR